MDESVLDLRAMLGLLRRRIGVVLVTAAIIVAATAIVLLAIRPVYTATALVLVDPGHKNLLAPDTQLSGSSSESLRVDSEVELVKSETTLLAVAGDLHLATDSEFGPRLGLADKAMAFLRLSPPPLPSGDDALHGVMDKLHNAVAVDRRGLTFLIAVSGRSVRPDFAATLANAVARTYIRQQLDAKIASTLQSRDIVASRLADASAAVARSDQAFDTFIDANFARISEAAGRTDLASLHDRIDALAAARTMLSAQVREAETGLGQHDWAAVALSLKNEAIAGLENQRRDLAARLAGLAAGSGDAVDLRASLQRLDNDLDAAATRAVFSLRTELAGKQVEAGRLRDELKSAILAADLPSDILTALYEVQQNAEIARGQYQTLLTRRNDLDTQAYLQVADSRLVSEATPPSEPSFPNPRLALGAAGLFGLLLGTGLAFLVENFLGGFTSEEQAAGILALPVVSTIPRQRRQRAADAVVAAPLSHYSEAVRRLRIGIDQAVRRRRGVIVPGPADALIMVSSAVAGEGKTTIALSLARAYAQSGLSTLLIDCDLRRPGVHTLLGRTASEGLLDYLAAEGEALDLKAIMVTDAQSGAQIVLGSRHNDRATDQLLTGRTFARLLDAAREKFDIVILDTPPVGPVVDGLLLAGKADAVVFVVKWSATPQQQVRAALAALTAATSDKVPLLAVLNQQQRDLIAYGDTYAKYYAET